MTFRSKLKKTSNLWLLRYGYVYFNITSVFVFVDGPVIGFSQLTLSDVVITCVQVVV